MKKPNPTLLLQAAAAGALSFGVAFSAQADVLAPFSPINIFTPGTQALTGASSSINGDSLTLWTGAARTGVAALRRFDGNGVALDASEWLADPGHTQAALDKFGNFAVGAFAPDGNGKSISSF